MNAANTLKALATKNAEAIRECYHTQGFYACKEKYGVCFYEDSNCYQSPICNESVWYDCENIYDEEGDYVTTFYEWFEMA